MEKILLLFLVVLIIYFLFDSAKEGFVWLRRTPAPTTNLCSMRTTSSSCKGYGADGYCEWCGTNGCHSADEVAKYKYTGCKG